MRELYRVDPPDTGEFSCDRCQQVCTGESVRRNATTVWCDDCDYNDRKLDAEMSAALRRENRRRAAQEGWAYEACEHGRIDAFGYCTTCGDIIKVAPKKEPVMMTVDELVADYPWWMRRETVAGDIAPYMLPMSPPNGFTKRRSQR